MKEYGHRARPPMEGETMAGVESRIAAPLDKLEPLLPKRIKALHIDELTSGIIRSEDSTFIIDLEDSLITITDGDDTIRFQAGYFGGDETDYGMKLYSVLGATILDSTGGQMAMNDIVTANVVATAGLQLRSASGGGSSGISLFRDATQYGLLRSDIVDLYPTLLQFRPTNLQFFAASTGQPQAAALAAIDGGTINSGDAATDAVITNLRTIVTAMRTALRGWGLFAP